MKKELRFGFALMSIILIAIAVFLPWGNLSNGHLGLLRLSLVVVTIMPGFPTAFTLMGMGMIFAWRHRGIGGDGVVLHAPTPDGVSFRLINADGLPGEISGNGLRCLAALAVRNRWAPARHVVSTVVGPKAVEVAALAGGRYRIQTDLGSPAIGSRDVTVALEPPAASVIDHPLEAAGRRVLVTATSMGNPHCAVFLEQEASDGLLHELGPALERHSFFPKRTNLVFVTVLGRSEIRVRFWERGVGYTMASGTGSASAVVASIVTGRTGRRVTAVCDGGTLEIDWPDGGSVRQTGDVELLYEGEWGAG